MNDVIIVIPSLNPDDKLLTLLKEITESMNSIPILIIDDGSNQDHRFYFDMCQNIFNCHVITHTYNKGKGAALKTAIDFILSNFPTINFMVTIDADGQHSTNDVIKCIQMALINPEALVLGTRSFDKNTPLRSKIGNLFTTQIFKLFTGIILSDTQTGLRVIPRKFMDQLLIVEGDRYEYEMNMLISAQKKGIEILSQPIQTIYIDDNSSSHFRVFYDSFKIYSVFIRYILSSIISFFADILIYALFIGWLSNYSLSSISISSFIARIISSIINYFLNREIVFKKKGDSSLIKYSCLVLVQISTSSLLLYIITLIFQPNSTIGWKILIDSLLFFISFTIQKKFIFKG